MRSLLFLFPLLTFAQNIYIELPYDVPCTLEVTGRHQIEHPLSSAKHESRFSKIASVEQKPYGLSWGDDANQSDCFKISPLHGSRILLNGVQYTGSLIFESSKPVINEVDVNDLLHWVMQKKEFSDLNLETLKALACVLRTDLCFDNKFKASDVGYQGSALLYQFPKISAAIVETKDMVLLENKMLFPTTFCMDAAGKTASFDSIYRTKTLAPKGTSLPQFPSASWKKSMTKKEFCSLCGIDQIKHIGFYKDQESSKIYAVKIEDSNGPKTLYVEKFLDLLKLKSNQFDLKVEKDVMTFLGQGEGMGVGLCLKTCEELAKEGKNYKQILKACYPTSEICTEN